MSTRASILFVDDEERVVNQLRLIFRHQYDVHTATSGADALKILRSTPIDVLVSDQRMPGMLGIEVLAEARTHWPTTMRMLLTGYSDLAAIVGSVNDGEVFRFINKPWDHDEIQRIVAQAAAAGQAARAPATLALSSAEAIFSDTPEQRPQVMLIDDSVADLRAMADVLSVDQTCLTASSMQEALQLLSQNDVGVIVTEARVGRSDMGAFLHLLKQQHPMITTVMLTRSSDADLVIRLINTAQIFRFATKPLRKSVFQLAVAAAMKEHLHFRRNPDLVARHHVAVDEAAHQDSSLVAGMKQSLAGLRSRFAFLGRRRSAA